MSAVTLRDETEAVIRGWNEHEIGRGATPIIDFDWYPADTTKVNIDSRLTAYRRFADIHRRAQNADDTKLASRVGADLAYLRALMGERQPLNDYVQATQGCPAVGWPEQYITERGQLAREQIQALGIDWGPNTSRDLDEAEGHLDTEAAADEIRKVATELEPLVRHATGSTAPYSLTIETVEMDAYWGFWLDGAGQNVRLRLNLGDSGFTKVRARQFALHEVLGHGLQSATLSARCTTEDVPWVRLLSVHAPQQFLFEGLAQAMPLFVVPDDQALITRVRLDHYTQLVRAELHLAINAGATVVDCAQLAHERVPFWTDRIISDTLTDRSANPLLRSYLWSYPAGLDWFATLADAGPSVSRPILHAAYRDPLTPAELAALSPDGASIDEVEDS